ncbi:MAG: large subunit ribosomal protein [Patescibacteria group bacterium]|nr:large subunit ribosomal protein [Patescibacteria group bacterium]
MAKQQLTTGAVILTRPRITEKASALTERKEPVYTFEVAALAGKVAIMRAIKEKYGVTPLKVNIVNLPRKNVIVRGKRGVTAGIKKAMVFLPKGSQIDFI